MPTPDFEEWLARQEVDFTRAPDKERYVQMMIDDHGFHGGTVDILKKVAAERYEIFQPVGIRSFTRHYTYMGEPFAETRYGVSGERGSYGYEQALTFAEERWFERGDMEKVEIIGERLNELERYPERYRRRWEERG